MLDKEKCKQALEELTKWCDGGYFRYYQEYYETLQQLIKEHFEPQPYKLVDLKPNMWVWDDKFEDCRQIAKINEYGGIYWYGSITEYEADKFEEGRFFPVTKAMQYQGE